MTPFPRYCRRVTTLPSANTVAAFKNKYPMYSNINVTDYKKIISTFNSRVMEEVVENRNGVMLPDLLGVIFIGSAKTKKPVVSYTKYSNNEALKFTNIATDGKIMKFLFSSSVTSFPFKNFKCWSFKANRVVRRSAAKNFENNYHKYVDITNIKLGELFYTRKTEKKPEEIIETKEETYNEFDL